MNGKDKSNTPHNRTQLTIHEAADIFDAKQKNGYWQAKCPCHDDKQASLSISEGDDGRLLFKCHAGCETKDILAAKDLTFADITPDNRVPRQKQKPRIVATYDYVDETNKLLYQAVRLEPKSFFQRRPDGTGGWINKLDGNLPVPYRLPEVLQAVQDGRTIYIPEGEKDCDNLAKLGFVATTNHGGANNWKDALDTFFEGADVVILPDNDEPGRKHAKTVQEHLQGIAKRIKVLVLPGLPEKGDVSDWIAAGGNAAGLQNLTAQAQRGKLISSDDVLNLPPIEWLIPDIVQKEGITLLFGPSGAGKSILALEWALQVAQQQPVVYIAAEGLRSHADRIVAWRAKHKAQKDNLLFWPEPVDLLDKAAVDRFIDECKPVQPALVIMDTLARCTEGADENSKKEMDPAISALERIRLALKTAEILLHHSGIAGERERGTTALRPITEVTIELDSNGGLLTLKCKKSRDTEKWETKSYQMVSYEAREGQQAPVLIPADQIDYSLGKLTEFDRQVLACLLEPMYADKGAGFTALRSYTGDTADGKRVNKSIKALIQRGFIIRQGASGKKGTTYCLTEEGKDYTLTPDYTKSHPGVSGLHHTTPTPLKGWGEGVIPGGYTKPGQWAEKDGQIFDNASSNANRPNVLHREPESGEEGVI